MHILTLVMTLIPILASSSAYGNYVRFWRGAAQAEIERSDLIHDFNHKLFPATAALAQTEADLMLYLPAVPNEDAVAGGIPEEIALLVYDSEESYRAFRATPPGQHYGDLHWDLFDQSTSGSLVPQAWMGRAAVEEAYAVVPNADWSQGQGYFRVLRGSDRNQPSFLERAQSHIAATKASEPLAYYVLVARDYLMEYVLVANNAQIATSELTVLYQTELFREARVSDHGGLIYPLTAPPQQDQARSTWTHHIEAWKAQNLAEIMKDYNESSIVIQNDRIYRGVPEIRTLFARLFQRFETVDATEINRITVEGSVVYITWWADFPNIHDRVFGTDTFVVENGIITHQTIAMFPDIF